MKKQDVIDALERLKGKNKCCIVVSTITECQKVIGEMEDIGWIPVSERMPKCGERVLATDGGFVGEFYLDNRGKWKRYNVNDHSLLMALDILLWMPLPEPPKDGV